MPILLWMNQDPLTSQLAADYVRGMNWGLWPFFMYNAMCSFLRSHRLPEAPLYVNAITGTERVTNESTGTLTDTTGSHIDNGNDVGGCNVSGESHGTDPTGKDGLNLIGPPFAPHQQGRWDG
mmetsp:Transcript_14814/g.12318  ORF Transcript_14814/g.12318 Transcript_14814/m.12318 type:complete len:122 (-) Transcript_14814:57-422(-)